jgi:hypothetical protein
LIPGKYGKLQEKTEKEFLHLGMKSAFLHKFKVLSGILLLSCIYNLAYNQVLPVIDSPLIDTLEFAITDTVYVSTEGDDDNPGTESLPVATFSRAISLLPYGIQEINNGHAYGLVIIEEGYYHQAFRQSEQQWRQGNTYKNISVLGRGHVQIGGNKDNPLEGHLMQLRGSHIFIKNVVLKYGSINGLMIAGEPTYPPTLSDVVIEEVVVDSVAAHGMLIHFAERVAADRVIVKHAGGYDPPIPPYPCRTWPSGFKPYMSRHVSIKNSLVARNWGEGINFHNCEYGHVQHNEVHDNYAVNVYCDNSSKYIIQNNLIFNSRGVETHWRACYGFENAAKAPIGISIANERSCPTSLGFITNHNIPCSLECINLLTGNIRIPTVDSVFVFNNIILNGGGPISIWEGVTGGAESCMSNIWVVHNTCIGFDGDSDINNSALLNFNFASGISLFLNPLSSIRSTLIAQNVFSYQPDDHKQIDILRRVLHPTFPAPFDVAFQRNVWSHQPAAFGWDDHAVVHVDLPLIIDHDQVIDWAWSYEEALLPEGTPYPFITHDFLGRPRNRWLAGALEPDFSNTTEEPSGFIPFDIYPNPAKDFIQIHLSNAHFISGEYMCRIYDQQGRVLRIKRSENLPVEIDLHGLLPGNYVLQVLYGGKYYVKKIIKE